MMFEIFKSLFSKRNQLEKAMNNNRDWMWHFHEAQGDKKEVHIRVTSSICSIQDFIPLFE